MQRRYCPTCGTLQYQCPECGEWFTKGRDDQIYCRPRCRQRKMREKKKLELQKEIMNT